MGGGASYTLTGSYVTAIAVVRCAFGRELGELLATVGVVFVGGGGCPRVFTIRSQGTVSWELVVVEEDALFTVGSALAQAMLTVKLVFVLLLVGARGIVDHDLPIDQLVPFEKPQIFTVVNHNGDKVAQFGVSDAGSRNCVLIGRF